MWEKNLNTLIAVILSCVLAGAFFLQFFGHDDPCPLCMLQRLGMTGVALGCLMNVRFGVRKLHYGLALFSAVFGGVVALRQIALHVCPGFPTFGHPFWGLSLYTWSFIIFASSIAAISFLLIIFDKNANPLESKSLNWCGLLAFALLSLVSIGNIINACWLCGVGLCACS